MREDHQLREQIRRSADVPTPAPMLETVGRRARTIRVRRAAATTLVAVVVAAGIAIPLSGLVGIGDAQSDIGSMGARAGLIGFEPAEGWAMAASDPSHPDDAWQQAVFVTNGPFAPADLEGSYQKDGIVRLPSGAGQTQRALSDEGILIVASIVYESRNPLPPLESFPARDLPLRLPAGPPETSWEGYSEGLSRYPIAGAVDGRFVVVNVYFGSRTPSEAAMALAQEELSRLFVGSAPPPSVDDIDHFGIALDLPSGWHGRLYEWASGSPILEVSTKSVDKHQPGDPMIPNRGFLASLNDVSILLAESDVLDPGYMPLSSPISIREDDRCEGCEVLDDGTTPPSHHALFHRPFETGGRSFDLYVEFCFDPGTADLDRVNAVLSLIRIEPAPTAS
jgi:hypothetical protein